MLLTTTAGATGEGGTEDPPMQIDLTRNARYRYATET